MMDIRPFSENDYPALHDAISRDAIHPGEWKVEHFTQPNVVSQVIEDDRGPIVFVRFTKSLRISCVWNDAEDIHRNARAIILGLKDAVDKARASGYIEIIITTESDKLARFFENVMKMTKSGAEYVLPI
jgi:hypothetical protein